MPGFKEVVENFVYLIPTGRCMTYGQLAALAGRPTAARIVGGIAHYGSPGLPWHRVVNKSGGVARGYPGGREVQAELLRAEGVIVNDQGKVDIKELLWWPPINH